VDLTVSSWKDGKNCRAQKEHPYQNRLEGSPCLEGVGIQASIGRALEDLRALEDIVEPEVIAIPENISRLGRKFITRNH